MARAGVAGRRRKSVPELLNTVATVLVELFLTPSNYDCISIDYYFSHDSGYQFCYRENSNNGNSFEKLSSPTLHNTNYIHPWISKRVFLLIHNNLARIKGKIK